MIRLLQPWTTIEGPPGVSVTQSQLCWLDLADCTDVAFYLSIRNVSAVRPTLTYETSPSLDEDLFAAMATPATGVVARDVQVIRFASAGEPLSRWVRWRLSEAGFGAWSLTFRIWVGAKRQGNFRTGRLAPLRHTEVRAPELLDLTDHGSAERDLDPLGFDAITDKLASGDEMDSALIRAQLEGVLAALNNEAEEAARKNAPCSCGSRSITR